MTLQAVVNRKSEGHKGESVVVENLMVQGYFHLRKRLCATSNRQLENVTQAVRNVFTRHSHHQRVAIG